MTLYLFIACMESSYCNLNDLRLLCFPNSIIALHSTFVLSALCHTHTYTNAPTHTHLQTYNHTNTLALAGSLTHTRTNTHVHVHTYSRTHARHTGAAYNSLLSYVLSEIHEIFTSASNSHTQSLFSVCAPLHSRLFEVSKLSPYFDQLLYRTLIDMSFKKINFNTHLSTRFSHTVLNNLVCFSFCLFVFLSLSASLFLFL